MHHVAPGKPALPFRSPPAPERDQSRKPPVSATVGGIGEQAGAILKIEPHADDKPDARFTGRGMGADHARQSVAVGHRDRLMPQRRRLGRQLIRMRAAAQKTEIAGDLKLSVGSGHDHHANRPCRNQRGAAAGFGRTSR